MSGARVLLRLLHLADSAFPAGAYAFSDGLETLVVRGEVKNATDLHAFLQGQLQQGWGQCEERVNLRWSPIFQIGLMHPKSRIQILKQRG